MKGRSQLEQVKKDVNRKKAKLQEQAPLAIPTFAAPSAEQTATSGTMGLLTVEEFRQKRENMVREAAAQKQKTEIKEKKDKTRASKAARARRSFAEEEEDEEEEEKQKILVGKDPTVETSFLPDSHRAEEENRLRAELAKQWAEQQEIVKSESLVVIFSFWDGKGSRRALRVQKGSTIGEFMKQVRDTVEDVRGVPTDSLMFVKHDFIIPHHFTFYELLMARNASNSTVFDFTEEGSHHTKVCERRWYDQNKHIFPASKWVVFGR